MLGERVLQVRKKTGGGGGLGGDTCIGLEDIARKREGGLEIAPPPVGRGLNERSEVFSYIIRCVRCMKRRGPCGGQMSDLVQNMPGHSQVVAVCTSVYFPCQTAAGT